MKKIITTGSYDVLHVGHIRLLKYAKSLGDILIVCTDTDRRILERKGAGRPINDLSKRIEMLQSIKHIDQIWTFDSDLRLEDIYKLTKPDILVLGDEYMNKPIVGREFVKEIKFFDVPRETSSTKIINNYASDIDNYKWCLP